MNERSQTHLLKRAGVIAAKVGLAILAGVALLVGVTLTVLQTDWGSERIRRRLAQQVNDQIQGRLAVDRLSFRPNHVVLRDLRLEDPDGHTVARLAQVEVQLRLAALFRKELRVAQALLERPELTLVSTGRGLNLSRAVEPRHPEPARREPARPRTREDGWVIRVDQLELRDGAIRMISSAEPSTPHAGGSAATEERAPRADKDVTRLSLEHLQVKLSARYATGNRNLDLKLHTDGQHTVEPAGPFAVHAVVTTRAETLVHVAVDGQLLDHRLRVHADMRPGAWETLAADVLVDLPPMGIRGHTWGPLRVEGRANPGQPPKLRVAVTVPGIEVTGKSDSEAAFDFDGAVEVKNLRSTLLAVQALTGGEAAAASGTGRLTFTVGGPTPPERRAGWRVRWDSRFERLRTGETVLDGLSLRGQFHGSELEASVEMQEPEKLKLSTAATIAPDRRGATLRELSVVYAREAWALQKAARLSLSPQRSASGDEAGTAVSLERVRLVSGDQAISVEGSKSGEDLQASLAVEHLRLERLPAVVAPARLNLGGLVDVSVRAAGRLDDPSVQASVEARQLRVQGLSDVGLKMEASLAGHRLAGALELGAPEAAMHAWFTTAIPPLEPGAPLDLRAELERLDLGAMLSKVQRQQAPLSGAVTSTVRLTGSADDPRLDVAMDARGLRLRPPPTVNRPSARPVDVGRARVRLTYARRLGRADVDFTTAQGGDLKVDAKAKVDLSYPQVTLLPPATKIPVEGRVVARDFDVAWAAALNPRIETMSGHVTIDAKLAGTAADPQFVGDVRWKEGRLVARTPAPGVAAKTKPAPATRP